MIGTLNRIDTRVQTNTKEDNLSGMMARNDILGRMVELGDHCPVGIIPKTHECTGHGKFYRFIIQKPDKQFSFNFWSPNKPNLSTVFNLIYNSYEQTHDNIPTILQQQRFTDKHLNIARSYLHTRQRAIRYFSLKEIQEIGVALGRW